MTTVKVTFASGESIERVKAFVNIISQYPNDFDLVSGRYVIDAKSIMGIFSLDFSQPIDLVIHTDDADEIIEQIGDFLV